MARVIGTIAIDFRIKDFVTKEQLEKMEFGFQMAMYKWEDDVYEMAEKCGVEIDDIHPILLDSIEVLK